MPEEAELVPQPHGGALRKGNPGPRKAKNEVRKRFQQALSDPGRSGIVAGVIRDALAGDKEARRLVFEYGIGKPDQAVEVTGEGGGPVLLAPVLATLSDDELADAARQIASTASTDPARDGEAPADPPVEGTGEAGAEAP